MGKKAPEPVDSSEAFKELALLASLPTVSPMDMEWL